MVAPGGTGSGSGTGSTVSSCAFPSSGASKREPVSSAGLPSGGMSRIRRDIDPAPIIVLGRSGPGAPPEPRLAHPRRLGVLPRVVVQVEPQLRRRLRADVAPRDDFAPGEGARGVIEAHVDGVVRVTGREGPGKRRRSTDGCRTGGVRLLRLRSGRARRRPGPVERDEARTREGQHQGHDGQRSAQHSALHDRRTRGPGLRPAPRARNGTGNGVLRCVQIVAYRTRALDAAAPRA